MLLWNLVKCFGLNKGTLPATLSAIAEQYSEKPMNVSRMMKLLEASRVEERLRGHMVTELEANYISKISLSIEEEGSQTQEQLKRITTIQQHL